MITGHPLEKIINGPAHHTLHHIYFTVNYGQVSRLSFYISPRFPLMMWPPRSTSHGQTGPATLTDSLSLS